jgi:hypothetical protein
MVVAQGGRKRSFRSTAVTQVSALVIPEYLLYLWASRAVMVQSAGDGPARQNGQSPAPKSVVAIYQIWDFCEADSILAPRGQPATRGRDATAYAKAFVAASRDCLNRALSARRCVEGARRAHWFALIASL